MTEDDLSWEAAPLSSPSMSGVTAATPIGRELLPLPTDSQPSDRRPKQRAGGLAQAAAPRLAVTAHGHLHCYQVSACHYFPQKIVCSRSGPTEIIVTGRSSSSARR